MQIFEKIEFVFKIKKTRFSSKDTFTIEIYTILHRSHFFPWGRTPRPPTSSSKIIKILRPSHNYTFFQDFSSSLKLKIEKIQIRPINKR